MFKRGRFFYKSKYIIYTLEENNFGLFPPQNNNFIIIDKIDLLLSQHFRYDKKMLSSRFSQNDKCFVASINNEYAAVMWGHLGPCHIRGAGKSLNLDDNEIYLYGIFVKDKFRGKKVFSNLFCNCINYYSQRNVKKFWLLVDQDNWIMNSFLEKYSFEEYSRIKYFRFLTVNLLMEKKKYERKFTVNLQFTNKHPDIYVI